VVAGSDVVGTVVETKVYVFGVIVDCDGDGGTFAGAKEEVVD
jgi:hypothetical protein